MGKLNLRFLAVVVIVIVLQVVLTGCNIRGQVAPTPTPTALMATDTPVMDDPPEPTDTPQSAIATIPPLPLGELETIKDSFSFHPIAGFSVNLRQEGATITSGDASIYLLLMTAAHPGTESLEAELVNSITSLARRIEEFEMGEPYPITVDGIGGLAADFVGLYSDEWITGRMEVAFLDDVKSFTAFGFAIDGPGGDRWEIEGNKVFDTVIGSVTFSKPMAPLAQGRAVEMVKVAIEANIVSGQANAFCQTIEGDLVFGVSYATSLDPQTQPDEFYSEFNLVVLTASEGFARIDSKPVVMIVMAESVDSPVTPDNPPLAEVVVDRSFAVNWSEGDMSDEAFIESWQVVPLADL